MITMAELLKGNTLSSLDADVQKNLGILLERLNLIRNLWNKPMIVTSGFRSMLDHIRIYKEIAAKKGKPFKMSDVPMGSRHLYGMAADISDPTFELTAWCKLNNSKVLEDCQLWCEDDMTETRLHLQIEAPASGHRWFKP